jgi:hypothetical protein
MEKYRDSWCRPLRNINGQVLYGGAARNVRVARFGGVEAIVSKVARSTLEEAEARVSAALNAEVSPPLGKKAR